MKFRVICLLTALLLCVPARAAEPAPEIQARAAVVLHPETGRVLYEKNADAFLPIASTTKIMTALVVLERCDLSETVTIQPEDTAVEGSSMSLRPGETVTVEQLLYGLMLRSGNDAALALARYTAGSTEAFAELMNDKAASLGLKQTHFCNPHGLDAEGHGSTARELARLAAAAMENDVFRSIVSTERKAFGNQIYVNHNRLLRTYPGALGVKTGYTRAAGRILVSCAEREGTRFVCVTISDPDDWADHTALLDWAFASFRWQTLDGVAYTLPVVSGTASACAVLPEGSSGLLLKTGERAAITAELPRFVFAPLRPGDAVGTLTAAAPDGERVTVPLVSAGAVEADETLPLSFPERLGRFWRLAGRAGFSFQPRF